MSRLIEAERVKKKRLQKDEESLRKIVKVLHKKAEEFYNCSVHVAYTAVIALMNTVIAKTSMGV